MIEAHESMTAKLCSFARAYHSIFDRSKIFDDYLAYDMMGQDEYNHVCRMIKDGLCHQCLSHACPVQNRLSGMAQFLAPIPLSREAYTQRRFQAFVQKHPRCQYVICGAGMDTFSFRNANPHITVFEVDHPDTQRYKRKRIADLGWVVPTNINFVAVDFSRDILSDKLLHAGFDPHTPTLFTILGVTYYLSLKTIETTVDRMDEISPVGSGIILDYPDKTTFDSKSPDRVKRLTEMTARLGERMTQGFSIEEMIALFEAHHHVIDEHLTPAQIQDEFFHNRNDGLRAYENIHFLYAEKISPYYASKNTYMI